MNIATVPRSVLRLQYRVVRFPLHLVETQLMSRLDDGAPARLLYERSLGLLDSTVGAMLGDPVLQLRGNALPERSGAVSQAARSEAEATRQQVQTGDRLKAQKDKMIEDQKLADAIAAQQRDSVEAARRREENKFQSAENGQRPDERFER